MPGDGYSAHTKRKTDVSLAFGQHQRTQKTTLATFGVKWIFAHTVIKSMKKGRINKMTRRACEREHDFTLVLTGITDLTPEVEKAFFEAGCDDATLSMRSGRPFLTFSRLAPSLKDALLSAINDVRKANIGANVLRVDICNLVTQSEIAQRIGRTRQLVHQYVTGERGPGAFPPPVCNISDDDDSPLWYWCEVAYWLYENNMIPEEALRDAQALSLINDILELNHQTQTDPALAKEILEYIGSHCDVLTNQEPR